MDESTPSSDGRLFLPILALFASTIGLVVDVFSLFGWNQQLQVLGKYFLVGIAALAVTLLIYQLYRQTCWQNALRIRRTRARLQRFLDDHDGRPLDEVVDVRQIYLLDHCRRACQLSYSVIEFRVA